jgi:hypothetical protein
MRQDASWLPEANTDHLLIPPMENLKFERLVQINVNNGLTQPVQLRYVLKTSTPQAVLC